MSKRLDTLLLELAEADARKAKRKKDAKRRQQREWSRARVKRRRAEKRMARRAEIEQHKAQVAARRAAKLAQRQAAEEAKRRKKLPKYVRIIQDMRAVHVREGYEQGFNDGRTGQANRYAPVPRTAPASTSIQLR